MALRKLEACVSSGRDGCMETMWLPKTRYSVFLAYNPGAQAFAGLLAKSSDPDHGRRSFKIATNCMDLEFWHLCSSVLVGLCRSPNSHRGKPAFKLLKGPPGLHRTSNINPMCTGVNGFRG